MRKYFLTYTNSLSPVEPVHPHNVIQTSIVRQCLLSYTGEINSQQLDQGRKQLPDDVMCSFVCVEVLRPSQPNGFMSSAVSLPSHTFTGQA